MRKKITLGEWPVGTKLPQRKLAQMFHVNRSTVVTALDELKASGLIETKVGSGTVVANNTWNILGFEPSARLAPLCKVRHPPTE